MVREAFPRFLAYEKFEKKGMRSCTFRGSKPARMIFSGTCGQWRPIAHFLRLQWSSNFGLKWGQVSSNGIGSQERTRFLRSRIGERVAQLNFSGLFGFFSFHEKNCFTESTTETICLIRRCNRTGSIRTTLKKRTARAHWLRNGVGSSNTSQKRLPRLRLSNHSTRGTAFS